MTFRANLVSEIDFYLYFSFALPSIDLNPVKQINALMLLAIYFTHGGGRHHSKAFSSVSVNKSATSDIIKKVRNTVANEEADCCSEQAPREGQTLGSLDSHLLLLLTKDGAESCPGYRADTDPTLTRMMKMPSSSLGLVGSRDGQRLREKVQGGSGQKSQGGGGGQRQA